MKKLFTLALAIILTLTALCGVSLLADDVGTQAACKHLWTALPHYEYGEWERSTCYLEKRGCYEVEQCLNCGITRRNPSEPVMYEQREYDEPQHDYEIVNVWVYTEFTMYGVQCKECGHVDTIVIYN